ncbi:unnamed protein product [Gongylonema pulchrum]|uniref:EGF-like domain-containing protein n=1 Tax=Gongylonema pulchrum TaxID=637853 RepID=A0A183DEN1_9BILA|nr:unnamed protein product [Gongylonema pulchrum]
MNALSEKLLAIQGTGNCADPLKNDCDVNAECIDVSLGRHVCTCGVGYIGDGHICDGKQLSFLISQNLHLITLTLQFIQASHTRISTEVASVLFHNIIHRRTETYRQPC